MNTLDKGRLDGIIQSIQLAAQCGFSSLSSPTGYLLEAAIDLCLVLAAQFLEPVAPRQLNQGLKFLDDDKPDALGNSRSVRVGPKAETEFWDPKSAKFLRTQLASFFVLLKRREYDKAFLELLNSLAMTATAADKPRSKQSPKKDHGTPKNSVSFYYRRQRK